MSEPEGPERDAARAESLYSEFQRRRLAEEDMNLAELCRRHPGMEAALHVLDSLHRQGSLPAPGKAAGGPGPPRGESSLDLAAVLGLSASAEPTPGASVGPSGPRYRVEGEIARGGMGVVLRVFDRALDRVLAMKVLRGGGQRGRPEARERFLEEARLTAQLDHPGVVPVHDLGVDSETDPHFTMRLVKGRELGEVFRLAREGKEGLSLTRAVGLVLQACQAVAYAHSKGVIHRDLKPQNIMVGDFGEVYVMDWGLAKAAGRRELRGPRPERPVPASGAGGGDAVPEDSAPLLTREGTVVGTPAFMPPEQAAGRVEDVDHRSDVYALGAILYTLLSGEPPYSASGAGLKAQDVLAKVLAGPPAKVHDLARDAPPELAAICERAMAREKAARYPSSREMASDLQAYLEGRVVRAYETGALAELKKWVSRNRLAAAASALALAAVLAGLGAAAWIQTAANQALKDERDQVVKAQGERDRQAKVAESRLRDVLRLADQKRLKDLLVTAETLWPCLPQKAPAMERWLAEAADLESRFPAHRDSLVSLEKEALQEEGSLRFASPELEWQHEALAELVRSLTAFLEPGAGAMAGVRGRLEWARAIVKRSLDDHREDWQRAIASIESSTECPAYQGLRIKPQVGLVPIERDAGSGLWEFAHLQTGSIPRRDGPGRLALAEASSLVFVLVPGGTFRMGAAPPAKKGQGLGPGEDPQAEKNEGPVREVELDPFFISKFEMTQGQWLRFTGENPSVQCPGKSYGGKEPTLLHPVENVSREQCEVTLARLGLVIPTEAQWEYCARAGTTSVWWTGDDPRSIQGAANLADRYLKRNTRVEWPYEEWLDDGHAGHAPVGSYRANPFGLDGTMGNVWEWVRDAYAPYREAPRNGDGERAAPGSSKIGVCRGGAFDLTAESARSANRLDYPERNRDNDLGVRPARQLTQEGR